MCERDRVSGRRAFTLRAREPEMMETGTEGACTTSAVRPPPADKRERDDMMGLGQAWGQGAAACAPEKASPPEMHLPP